MKRTWVFLVISIAALLAIAASATPAQRQASTLEQDVIDSVVAEAVALGKPFGSSLLKLGLVSDGNLSLAVGAVPDAQGATDVLLQPGDVGPNFILVSTGVKVEQGVSLRVNSLRPTGKHTYYIEPDGILFVRSLAVVAGDPFSADGIFDSVGKGLFEGTQEVPVPALGERTRAAIEWGEKPFDAAGKVVMFRRGSVVAFVIVISFEAPETMADILPLAQTMAARAGR